jgi:hypothetical protein
MRNIARVVRVRRPGRGASSALLGPNQFLYFEDYRLIRRPVHSVLSDVHISDAALLIEDEGRWMSYAAVLGGVHDSVLGYRFLLGVGENLEFRAGGLGHRPRIGLLIYADGEQLRARLFYLFVVLSQPGELLCAGASPEAAIEDKHDR